MEFRDLVKFVNERKKGFALLIAVVVSGVILSISVSVVNNAIKEVILAATVRNSLVSMYRADSGMECFLYWDNVRGNFNVTSAFVDDPDSPDTIECSTIRNIPVDERNLADLTRIYSFWLKEPFEDRDPCGYVSKTVQDDTIMRSWGFNTCDANNSRRVDRAFEVKL